MKKLLEKFKNIWAIEELRKKIIFTLIVLVIYRLGTFVALIGVNPAELEGLASQTKGGLLGLVNSFAGGAFARGAIFALGIMPYISASIFMQLASIAIPTFQRLQKEGEEGRRKINQYTRILTIVITAVQAIAYLNNLAADTNAKGILFMQNPDAMSSTAFFIVNTILIVAGTMFTMWLGERITDKGLGNGISLIIMVGIIARLPGSFLSELSKRSENSGPLMFLVELGLWFFIILFVILLTQGSRKITINYAKRVVGNRQYGGARQFLPIKILAAGVMPIIFAQAIMFIPGAIIQMYKNEAPPGWLQSMVNVDGVAHNVVLMILIVAFTYFYTAIIFNPVQMADEMKRNNGFIPGIKPGKATANFIDDIISKITLPGAIAIGIIAILPAIASAVFKVNTEFGQFFGGTSLLILVGVVLDTLQQIDSYLLMRKYDGLMSSGRLKGRMSNQYQNVDY